MSENYCPICGANESIDSGHRCKQSTLDRIDAAMKLDREPRIKQGFRERLKDGFAMLQAADNGHY